MSKKLEPCPSCGKTCLATDRDTGVVACMLCGMRAPSKEVWNRRTATEANEPLTCKGCTYFDNDDGHVPCHGCKRLVRVNDFYRRLPEGETK